MKLYVVCLGAILGWSSAHVMVQAQDAPIPPTPEIFGFWPTNGSPGTFVTIQGTNFFNVQSVQINGVNASVFNFTLDPGPPVRGYVRVPEGATTGPITVVTLAGTAKSADDFVVQEAPAPVITGLGSPSGSVGDSVVITGSNFVDVVSVKFNGVDGLWESASMEAINADVPEGATTGLIEVITKHGQAFSPAPFIIVPKDQTPIIQDFSPVQGPAGTSVLFNGDNFDGITAVLFNGVSAQFTAMFSRAFFAKVPSGATTGPITVQTQHGTFTTSNSFTVTSLPAPVIQQISPSQAAIGAIVQITGFNLDQVQSVLFNGSPASFSHFGGL